MVDLGQKMDHELTPPSRSKMLEYNLNGEGIQCSTRKKKKKIQAFFC